VDNSYEGWDIMGVRSTDSGTTWGAPFVVNDITAGGQCKGWSHFDVSGGLHVIYYHTPDWPTNAASIFELRYQYSSDSGATFNPSIRVSDTSFTSLADFMGEYHICLSDSQYLYAIWTDGRNGDDNDLYFSKALLAELYVKDGSPMIVQTPRILHVPTIWCGSVTMEIESNHRTLRITLYDVNGRLIREVYEGEVKSGRALKLQSAGLPRGVIFVRACAQNATEVIKVINLGTD
jgi:hypothetical protein